MDATKALYKTFLKGIFSDPVAIGFWDGEEVNYGEGPARFKIIFKQPLPVKDLMKDPALAFGEGFMDGLVEIEGNLRDVIESLYHNEDSFLRKGNQYRNLIKKLPNNIKNSRVNASSHYDVGNDFYKLWLDKSMTYSCGYFKSPEDSLEQAQQNKINHILKKLYLQEGQTLLDIGCGWGNLMLTAVKEYKVKVLGITLSDEQFAAVKEKIKNENLENLAEVRLADYRELKEITFDRVLSVGMVEHVGKDHLADYFTAIDRLLKPGGVSLLHSITGIKEGGTNTWINKYIFPGGYIPALHELVSNLSEVGFYLLDVESLRRHYVRTLEYWDTNFENAIEEVRKMKDEKFIRMWQLYLKSCAASFHCGNIDVHQLLFTKGLNNEMPWTREYIYS